MEFQAIKSLSDPLYKDFYVIYATSFPIFEQRTEEQQKKAFNHPAYHLEYLSDNGKLIFFIGWWEFDEYIYIEHLAVNPECRGQQVGSKALESFTGLHNKTLLLEIDPLVDEISEKRFRFYKNIGFHLNPYRHAHPPYRKGHKPHDLLVLSHGKSITQETYDRFARDLQDIVMRFDPV